MAAGLLLLLSACDTGFLGETDTDPIIEGERIPIMLFDRGLEEDPQIAGLEVRLPRPYTNPDWPQPGGNAQHVMQHVDVATAIDQAWSRDIGAGAQDETSLLSSPIVVGNRLLVLDAEGQLSALSTEDGDELWDFDTRPSDEEDAVFSGGITSDGARVFAATGSGETIALDLESGQELWRVKLPAPIRGAPTVADGRVFVISIDNQSFALDVSTGERLWSHTGIAEISALLGGASPAVAGDVVIIPYSSGEIYALRVENGRLLWVDSLSQLRSLDPVARLSDVRGNPAVDDTLVVAISHGGRMIATDLVTGRRVWDRQIGGVHMPWIAGEFIYVVSNGGEVICLTRRDGRVKWIQRLPAFEDPEDREQPIYYAGPTLAGDRLIVANSIGEAFAISPYSGEILGLIDLDDPVYVAPIVANGTIYFLTDDARVVAYR